MCEAQILFQKKVQSTIQELITKHILLYLEHWEVSQCTRTVSHLYFVPLKRRLYFVFNFLFDVLCLISKGYFYDFSASLTSDNNRKKHFLDSVSLTLRSLDELSDKVTLIENQQQY